MDEGELMFEAIFGKENFMVVNEELREIILNIDNWNNQPSEFKNKLSRFLEKSPGIKFNYQ